MKQIKEYLTLKQAQKIKTKMDSVLPTGVECVLEYKGKVRSDWKLCIKNEFGSEKELSRVENDIEELIGIIFKACKRFYFNFTFHSHGLDRVYIDIEVRN